MNKNKQWDEIVGHSLKTAQKIVEKAGWILRIQEEDGKSRIGTCELRNNRVNVNVESGFIKDIMGIG